MRHDINIIFNMCCFQEISHKHVSEHDCTSMTICPLEHLGSSPPI